MLIKDINIEVGLKINSNLKLEHKKNPDENQDFLYLFYARIYPKATLEKVATETSP